MNSQQIKLIREASDSIKDCSFHLQDAGNELQRVIDILVEIVMMVSRRMIMVDVLWSGR